jgi:nucleoid-associated protein YgaU
VTWGEHLALKAVAESVQIRFTLFSEDGVALRARVTLMLRSYRTLGEQLRALNLQSPDQSKSRRVRAGDTLALIAYDAYGDPTLWRAVAAANPELTADPLRLKPGSLLKLPPLADLAGARAP